MQGFACAFVERMAIACGGIVFVRSKALVKRSQTNDSSPLHAVNITA